LEIEPFQIFFFFLFFDTLITWWWFTDTILGARSHDINNLWTPTISIEMYTQKKNNKQKTKANSKFTK
jgi:hypothetical protein